VRYDHRLEQDTDIPAPGVYRFEKWTRAAYNAKAFLEGYKCYLQTDGYKGYDTAIEDMPDIIHVGCFAHYLRKKIIRGKHCKYRI